MRLVLDTDVIIAALRSPSGASAHLLQLVAAKRAELLLSVTLAFEYEAVCSRAEHRLASGLSERELQVFVGALFELAEPVYIHFHWRPQLRDPGDEMVLETAINGRADALVTFNRKHFGDLPARFGVELLSPGDALWRLRP